MKILVLQLARFGDIYQTWPALQAFRRVHPNAEVHLMVRERFQAATQGLVAVQRVITLDTKSLIEGLVQSELQVDSAVANSQEFLTNLANEKYDWVFNLSYSRVGAFLATFLSSEKCQVFGYGLHADGVMYPMDSTSSYFMAQVGVGRYNRFHLTDIFANQMNLEFLKEDFDATMLQPDVVGFSQAQVAIHIGASEADKTLSATKWTLLVSALFQKGVKSLVLLGSSAETEIARQIESSLSVLGIQNLVGKTTLPQIFTVLRNVEMLVAGDSSLMQIASLVNCKTLNISSSTVSFWETGPRADHSQVYTSKDPELLDVDEVCQMATSMLQGQAADLEKNVLAANSHRPEFIGPATTPQDDFCWQMVSAIYLNESFPVLQSIQDYEAMNHMNDLNQMALQQIESMQAAKTTADVQKFSSILAQVDQAFVKLSRVSPCTSILWNWLQVERVKIPPVGFSEVLMQTKNLHLELSNVLRLYVLEPQQEAENG